MIQSNQSVEWVHPVDYIHNNLLTYQEAAELFNVELSTIHRWLNRNMIPRKKHFRLATNLTENKNQSKILVAV